MATATRAARRKARFNHALSRVFVVVSRLWGRAAEETRMFFTHPEAHPPKAKGASFGVRRLRF